MTTILVTFCIALVLSNLLTLAAKRVGIRLEAMALVGARKVHTHPIPPGPAAWPFSPPFF